MNVKAYTRERHRRTKGDAQTRRATWQVRMGVAIRAGVQVLAERSDVLPANLAKLLHPSPALPSEQCTALK